MNKKSQSGWIIGFILVVLFLVFAFGYHLFYALTSGSENIIIKEKWVKYHGNDAKYLVSSTNGQVFQITDTIIKWRWNSSDLYAYLEPGMNCNIVTQGWRFPILSDYKNILSVSCDENK